MKKVFILLVAIIAIIGCEKAENESSHEEIMYQMALDTLANINVDDPDFGAYILNSDSVIQIGVSGYDFGDGTYHKVDVDIIPDSIVVHYRWFEANGDIDSYCRIPISYTIIQKFTSMWRICTKDGVVFQQEPPGSGTQGEQLIIHLNYRPKNMVLTNYIVIN